MSTVSELIAMARLIHLLKPSLAKIMDRIGISRATAYRHLDVLRNDFGAVIQCVDGHYVMSYHGIFSAEALGEWSADDDSYVLKAYQQTPVQLIAEYLGRTVPAVHNRASKLGITGKESNRRGWTKVRWTAEEDDIVREKYPQFGMKTEIFLPGRTGMAIAVRAKNLGVAGKRGPKRNGKNR